MQIDLYTKQLVQQNGIWYAPNNRPISYPDHSNESCFQIEENSFWFKHRNQFILQAIKNNPPAGTFFDIGGGNGFVAKAIQDAGIEVALLEPGEKGCLNAKKRGINNVICSTLEDAGFEKNTIPAVGVFDVVEHIENDMEFLGSIHDYLKEDGFLYITVPAHNFLWSNEDDDAGHFNRYTISALTKKLIAAGFSVPYSTYIFSILPLPILLMRTIPSKFGFNKNSNTQEKHSGEHKNESNLLGKIWAWELGKIKKGEKIPFGGSCLVVAKKN